MEQSVIDVIKFNRAVTGLSEKDATVIRLGRALLRDHKVSSELWAKTVELFGRQGAIEIVATIGDYVMAGMMLTAVDQQLTPNLKLLLPRANAVGGLWRVTGGRSRDSESLSFLETVLRETHNCLDGTAGQNAENIARASLRALGICLR